MDFDLSKPQKLLQESAKTFFSRECSPERVRELMATETAHDEALWRAMADQGWTGLIVPEAYGGLGLGLVELAVVVEEMGRANLPGAFISTLWAAALMERAGSEAQKAEYLDAISAGELKATVALLEASADWHPAAVQLRAEVEGQGYRLNGRKEFVTDAAIADVILVAARTSGGLIILVVKKDSAGVTITETPAMDATRKLYTVEFQEAHIEAALTNKVKDALEYSMGVAAIALSAEMLGGMQWTLDTTVEYAKTRLQFGRPIGTYQAVQHHCADMLLMTESSRSAVYYAAYALSEKDSMARHAVSIAKAYCSDAAREVGNLGIQCHGGIGFTWEHNLHLYYKRAKSSEIMLGDATYHREELARLVIDRAAD
ncbi:MAG: acyl-CoA/acyl-ACP dehydrogenase [Acidobacteria bacterium]|nr:acyl-CoA/acyl-ACP dehydrogenase [Acidobacteriota bacterium]